MTTTYRLSQAQYETTKTQTTDLQIQGPEGVLQIRIVSSANGHKRDVFAGYSADQGRFEDHRYCQQAQKSAKKWMGRYEDLGYYPFYDIVDQHDLGDKLTGDVADKIEEALGFRPIIETAAQKDAREKQQWAQAQMASEERIAQQLRDDSMFGMF